eukprot:scaffold159673_cov35-Prasinocladus_malaysianus.AAC.1
MRSQGFLYFVMQYLSMRPFATGLDSSMQIKSTTTKTKASLHGMKSQGSFYCIMQYPWERFDRTWYSQNNDINKGKPAC